MYFLHEYPVGFFIRKKGSIEKCITFAAAAAAAYQIMFYRKMHHFQNASPKKEFHRKMHHF